MKSASILFAFFAMVFVGLSMAQERRQFAPVPDLAGETNWGTITQDGAKFTISGHDRWYATGEIRRDRTVFVQWVELDTGRVGPAVYRWDGKELMGEWGWLTETRIERDGSLQGETKPDRIWRIIQEAK